MTQCGEIIFKKASLYYASLFLFETCYLLAGQAELLVTKTTVLSCNKLRQVFFSVDLTFVKLSFINLNFLPCYKNGPFPPKHSPAIHSQVKNFQQRESFSLGFCCSSRATAKAQRNTCLGVRNTSIIGARPNSLDRRPA